MLLSFILLTSCTEDSLPELQNTDAIGNESVQTLPVLNYKLNMVSKDQLFDDPLLSSTFKNKRTTNRAGTSNSLFDIQTDEAKVLESDKFKTYVFRAGSDQESFINYAVIENKLDQSVQSYYIRYYPTTAWVNRIDDQKPFEGFVARYDEQTEFLASTTGDEFPPTENPPENMGNPPKTTFYMECMLQISSSVIHVGCSGGNGHEIPGGTQVNICTETVYDYGYTCQGGSGGGAPPPGYNSGNPDYGSPNPNHGGGSGGNSSNGDNDGNDEPQVPLLTLDRDALIFNELNNPCLQAIYDKFREGDNTITQYIQNFDPDGSVANLTLKTDDDFKFNQPSDIWGAGAITSKPDNYMITITFNTDPSLTSSASHFSSMILAQEFMHEMIHAEMYRKLLSYAQKPEIPWTREFIHSLRNDFSGLEDYYTRYWLDLPSGQKPTSVQHQAMAEHYRDIMTDALSDYDNNQHSPSFYEALAWLGLKDTVAWDEFSEKFPQQAAQINMIIQNAMQDAPCQ